MWYLILCLFIAPIYALDRDEVCLKQYRDCDLPNPVKGLPENAEDLLKVCQAGIGIFTCRAAVIEACKDVEDILPYSFEYVSDTLAGIKHICNTSSDVNKGIIENLACFKTLFENQGVRKCFEFSEEIRQNKVFENIHDDGDMIKVQQYQCLRSAVEVSCILAEVEKECGKKAEIIALEAILSVKAANILCHHVELDKVKEFIEVIQIEQQMADRVISYLDAL